MRISIDHRETGQVWLMLLIDATETNILTGLEIPIKGYAKTVADVTEMQGIIRRIYDSTLKTRSDSGGHNTFDHAG